MPVTITRLGSKAKEGLADALAEARENPGALWPAAIYAASRIPHPLPQALWGLANVHHGLTNVLRAGGNARKRAAEGQAFLPNAGRLAGDILGTAAGMAVKTPADVTKLRRRAAGPDLADLLADGP